MIIETLADYTPTWDRDNFNGEVPLYQSLRSAIGRSDQDWEDRIHDTIVWMLEHRGTLTNELGEEVPIDSPIGLAVAHVKGRVKNARRKAIRNPHDSLDAPSKDDAPSLAETLAAKDRADARAIIVQALRKLKPVQRAVVRLTLSGYTTRDIAAKLSTNAMNVSRLSRRALEIMAQ